MNSSNLKARTRAMLIQTKENKISQLKDYLSYAAVNFVLLRDTEFRYNKPLEQSCQYWSVSSAKLSYINYVFLSKVSHILRITHKNLKKSPNFGSNLEM